MQYIDSGARDPAEALGSWLLAILTPDVAEVRLAVWLLLR